MCILGRDDAPQRIRPVPAATITRPSRIRMRRPGMTHPPPSSGDSPVRANRCAWLTLLILLLAAAPARADAPSDASAVELFETDIRPVLIERCLECHGKEDQSGELRVDSREFLLKGGENGRVIVPGHPEQSRLVEAIRRSGDLEMPRPDLS